MSNNKHTYKQTHTRNINMCRTPLRVGNKRNNNIGRMSRRGSLKKRNRLTQEQKVRSEANERRAPLFYLGLFIFCRCH